MNEASVQVSLKATEVIDKLAEKVGIATDEIAPVFQEVVRQCQIKHIVMAVFGAVLMAVCCAMFSPWMKMVKKTGEHDIGKILICVGWCLMLVIGMLVALVVFTENIAGAFAPLPEVVQTVLYSLK